jgi:hypothetical protein
MTHPGVPHLKCLTLIWALTAVGKVERQVGKVSVFESCNTPMKVFCKLPHPLCTCDLNPDTMFLDTYIPLTDTVALL